MVLIGGILVSLIEKPVFVLEFGTDAG